MFWVSINSNVLWALCCVSPCNDICIVGIKDIRNMHAVSTNQIADILRFNNNSLNEWRNL